MICATTGKVYCQVFSSPRGRWWNRVCQLDQPALCYGSTEMIPKHLQRTVPIHLRHSLGIWPEVFRAMDFVNRPSNLDFAACPPFSWLVVTRGVQIKQEPT